jgi:ectoine hydroxylase-related dioxygenase (phytanoyl-CoA dioxygenase family)
MGGVTATKPLGPRSMATYRRDGYLELRALSPPKELARLRRLFAACFQRRGDEGVEREWDARGVPIIEKLADPERDHPELLATRLYQRGRTLAAQALGLAERRLTIRGVLVRKQAAGAPTGWHQHAANPMPSFIKDEVTLWMTLDDVTARNGCLTFLPGSHREPVLPHGPDNYITSEIDPERVARCPMKAGAGTLIHTGVAHGSEPNRSGRVRRAWTLYCFLKSGD